MELDESNRKIQSFLFLIEILFHKINIFIVCMCLQNREMDFEAKCIFIGSSDGDLNINIPCFKINEVF